jgi:tryptophan synthase alpha subunit
VTFVTAGYPTANDTVPILLAMQEGGADIIELGVPFSDPIADGPAIQETNTVRHWPANFNITNQLLLQIALSNDVDYAMVLGQLREARSRGLTAPVLFMGVSRSFHRYFDCLIAPVRLLQPSACLWGRQGNPGCQGIGCQWIHHG